MMMMMIVEINTYSNIKHLKLFALSSASLKSSCKSGKIFSFLSSHIKTFSSFVKKRSLWTEEFRQ